MSAQPVDPDQIRMLALPMENGSSTLECSVCGPLGVTLTADSTAGLYRHLSEVHQQGARQ